MSYWTAEELKAAVERCEADVERLVEEHARPELIHDRREGIIMLHRMLAEAEAEERTREVG